MLVNLTSQEAVREGENEPGREAERFLPAACHCQLCGEVLSSELPNILEMASEEKDLYLE